MTERRESLPRHRILRNRLLLQRTRREGRRVGDRNLTLFVGPAPAEAPTQAAFLTPKRLGIAVVRNRLRRRMREIHRRLLRWPERGLVLVWAAKPPAVTLTFDELKACMQKLARRHERDTRAPA